MIGRIEKILLMSLFVAVCMLLLAMFLLNNTAAENTAKIYNISIFVRNPSERFMKGLDQAALDYNVDVHFVSGYSGGDSKQQIEYLSRELENNVDAVVLEAENADEMEEYIDSFYSQPAVVTVGQKLQRGRSVHVGADDLKIGEKLGGLISQNNFNEKCIILCPVDPKPYQLQRIDGLKKILIENEISFSISYCTPDNLWKSLVGYDNAVIAVLDESLLISACEQAGSKNMLFGVGFVSGARDHLEDGRILGLVVYSDYDMGYLSLQEAVFMADNRSASDTELGLYLADADTMREPPLVYILFPIG